jgi:putative nucleotidyltransferase with HDIG domain
MKLRIHNKYLILIGAVVLFNIVFPPPRTVPQRYTLIEGEIASYDVIAPYDFVIPKTEEELYREREEISKSIPPVFVLDRNLPDIVEKNLNRFENTIDSLVRSLGNDEDSIIALVQKEYAIDGPVIIYVLRHNWNRIIDRFGQRAAGLYLKGIYDTKLPDSRIVTIVSGDKEIVESVDRMYSIDEAESLMSAGESREYRFLTQFFLKPNIIYSDRRTNERVDEVFANRPKSKGKVLKGEIIVEKHKRITKEAMEIVEALESTYTTIGFWEIVKTILFRNLILFAALFLLYNINRTFEFRMFAGKKLYFVALLSAVYLIVGKVVCMTDTLYLLPISFFIFLFTLYFNFHIGMVFTIVFAAVFGISLNSLAIFIYLFVSGMVTVFSTQTINTRLSIYRPMIYIAIANIAAILFIEIYVQKSAISILHLSEGVLNAILGGVFLVLLLPLFEKLFDFTTDLTLLELGNLNLPLFKEMAMEAPGTYHHSIVVGNLAEGAARAIGADPILARVGSYYHDIGKLKKPEYFIENQFGVKNPHDKLKPQMSALIIISHVKDGVDMAKKMKLPKRLISIIEQHHGTTPTELFYQKALSESPETNQDSFRYPGPKPKTKEAAIIMLADSVEAAARSEKNITVSKIQKILRDTFARKFDDGQLDDSPINRHDLELIKASFISILTGVFHPRVEYDQSNGLNFSNKNK